MKINYKFSKERLRLFLGLVSAFTIVILIVSYTVFNNEGQCGNGGHTGIQGIDLVIP